MQKLKIVKVVLVNDPKRMNNGGELFSVWADVVFDGTPFEKCKVSTFKKNMALVVGAEFTTGENTREIRVKTWDGSQGAPYTEFTIFAMPNERFGGGAPSGGHSGASGQSGRQGSSRRTLTREQLDAVIQYANEKAGALAVAAPGELRWSYFSAILKAAVDVMEV